MAETQLYRLFREVSQTVSVRWEEEVFVKADSLEAAQEAEESMGFDEAATWTEVADSSESEPYYKYPDEQRDGGTEVELVKEPTPVQIARAITVKVIAEAEEA